MNSGTILTPVAFVGGYNTATFFINTPVEFSMAVGAHGRPKDTLTYSGFIRSVVSLSGQVESIVCSGGVAFSRHSADEWLAYGLIPPEFVSKHIFVPDYAVGKLRTCSSDYIANHYELLGKRFGFSGTSGKKGTVQYVGTIIARIGLEKEQRFAYLCLDGSILVSISPTQYELVLPRAAHCRNFVFREVKVPFLGTLTPECIF